MRRISWLSLVAASAAALSVTTGAASSGSDMPSRVGARCLVTQLSVVIGGRRRCLGEGWPCRRRLDSAYHRYLFHCHAGYLRVAWDLLRRRPLHVPTIASGTPCPATGSGGTAAQVGLEATLPFRVWGPGPAYPFIGAAGEHAEFVFDLPMGDPADYGTEWGGTKAIWGISTRYVGPVLVRGRQLDGPNEVRFQNGSPGFTAEERLHPSAEVRLRGPNPHGNPATTRLRGPGCYAYQVDGRGFSYLIVFEARVRA
jgi:hypothetical protein